MRLLAGVLVLSLLLFAAPDIYGAEEEEAADGKDTVILNNGSVWVGRIIKEDEEVVVVEHASDSGGLGRYTFRRTDIKTIRRASGKGAPRDGGPRPIRDEWFLLRSAGRIIGTRHLEIWTVKSRGKPGYRIEEKIEYFAQGPQLPPTRTHRTEEVDLRFFPRLLAFHEEGDRSEIPDGPKRYSRDVSGRVVDGVWRGSVFRDGTARRREVRVPTGARGRLGFREHLLHLDRHVRLLDARIIDPDREGLVSVRAGFTSVSDDPTGRRPGHEFHWEENGRRFISYFHPKGQRVVREQVAEGIMALPVSREQADAAMSDTSKQPLKPEEREIKLAEPGIAFTPPDAIWRWKADIPSAGNTGWRRLGRLSNEVLVTDVRVEWHPFEKDSEKDPAAVEKWLLGRLRSVSPDLKVIAPRLEVRGLEGAWRIVIDGTLKRDSVRTIAVVVDRKLGRVVLLLACPAGAWGQVRPALERFLHSIRLL